MISSAPVSEFIWRELERAFNISIDHLIKDIATSLGQSHDPLKRALKGKIGVHLVEDGADSFVQRCTYKCVHADTPAFLSECGEPILWLHVEQETKRCPRHLGMAALPHPPLTLKPLEGGYGYAEDGTVYNGKGEACGFYCDDVLTLIQVV